jgi:non-ribosomal peptide synthetase component E (peptide arylation enzyme)
MACPTRLTQETIRNYLQQGVWADVSLSQYWDRNGHRNPAGIAVTDGERAIAWAEARRWTDHVALALIHLGLARDDVVIVQLPNCVDLPLLRVACEKAGTLCLPVPWSWRQSEMGYCLDHTEAGAVVLPWRYRGFDYFAMIQELQNDRPHLRHILVAGKEIPSGALCLNEIASQPWEKKIPFAALEKRRYQATEVSLINATTGSTGLPKFAEYTAAARLLYGRSYIESLGLTGQDVLAALSPAAGGPNIPVYFAAPQIGARAVFLQHFDPEVACELIERERVTLACLVPAELARIVRYAHSYDLSSIRFWLSVGAPLPPHLAREAEERLGGIVLSSYGAVDWGGAVFPSPLDPPEVRYHTVGKPRAGTEVRIVNECGRPLEGGQTGEVQGRGPSCSIGYYRCRESTRKRWSPDGWLSLGDLAEWDERGNVIVVGRKQELIIRGGQNIQPIEIENYLLAHPKVKQVAVIGMPDQILGERVCAYVVPRGDESPTLEEILSFLQSKKIASYKLPEQLEVIDSLPMISDTKVDRQALRADISQKRLGSR